MPFSLLALEKPDYEVVSRHGELELRRYAPMVVATTRINDSRDLREAGNKAFRRLGGYIFGDNARDERIAMTAPVMQTGDADAINMSFYMPPAAAATDLPDPVNSDVEIVERPGQLLLVHRYKGSWSEARYRKELELTLQRVADLNHFSVAGEPIWARYDPPFMPGFLKTNEILVPVEAR